MPPASAELPTDALPLGNAALVQPQIRIIALENWLAAALVDASDQQLNLARVMTDCTTPRAGSTPHSLTTHTAARMIRLIEKSGRLHTRPSTAASPGAPPHEKTPGHPGFSRTPSGTRTRSGWMGEALSGQGPGLGGAA